ncbi:MAG: cysteine desulfurase-like protein, partial [Actinobacteria bacterium]|nr:cysteine desulfurase-like protein [Actinomycetota bacterium]
MLDVSDIRRRFPALRATTADGRSVVHADAPGGTQVPEHVIAAMGDYLRAGSANAHGAFPTSRATDALCDSVRAQAAAFVDGWPDGIVFGPNMTTLTLHLADALASELSADDRLVCTRLDHDANVAPWLHLAERTGAAIDWVDLDVERGTLDLDTLRVDAATRLIAFPAASNALGTVVDPAPFVEAAASVGAITFMDAVHTAPHTPITQRASGVDVVVCSPYKFFGPHAWILSADPNMLERWKPSKVRPAPDHGPQRWQNGTAAFEAIAGVGAACSYIDEIGLAAIEDHERHLTTRFLAALDALDHVRLHGVAQAEGRTPTFAVTVVGYPPVDVARQLADDGIYVWAGHYYAIEPLRRLGLLDRGGAVRIGFVHYHGPDDVDRVLAALDRL